MTGYNNVQGATTNQTQPLPGALGNVVTSTAGQIAQKAGGFFLRRNQ